MKKLNRYGWNLLITIDQFLNTILGGDPDETMSSRFGKWMLSPHTGWRKSLAYFICNILNLFEECHCIKSIEKDEGKNSII